MVVPLGMDYAGSPLARDVAVIPTEFGGQLTKADWASVDFVKAWTRRQSLKIGAIRQTISAIMATPEDTALLGISPRSPVLCAVEIYESDRAMVLGAF